jgi:APA family basic amino acid/polyamine antiporter
MRRTQRPLADVARLVMGWDGAGLIAIGALISVYGYLSAKILAVPRLTFALAERGDFPSFFAAIHPRFRTPHISILVSLCSSGRYLYLEASPGI